jgi:hypothetical protein
MADFVTLPTVEPLCVSREEGARLCGITTGTWDRWRRMGILPEPIPGTERWFLEQIRQTLRERCGMADAPRKIGNRGAPSDVGKNAIRPKTRQRERV